MRNCVALSLLKGFFYSNRWYELHAQCPSTMNNVEQESWIGRRIWSVWTQASVWSTTVFYTANLCLVEPLYALRLHREFHSRIFVWFNAHCKSVNAYIDCSLFTGVKHCCELFWFRRDLVGKNADCSPPHWQICLHFVSLSKIVDKNRLFVRTCRRTAFMKGGGSSFGRTIAFRLLNYADRSSSTDSAVDLEPHRCFYFLIENSTQTRDTRIWQQIISTLL